MRSNVNFIILSLLLLTTLSCQISTAQPDSYQPIFHITGQTSTSYMGSVISNCGDQNGDSSDEFLISQGNPNAVLMFYSGNDLDTIPDLIFGINFGVVASITYGENVLSYDFGVLLIKRVLNGYPKLYLYKCGNELDTIPDMIFQGEYQYNEGFGANVGIVDINGDSWNDLVTASYQYDPGFGDRGRLYVFYGGADMDTIPDFTITAAYNAFGDRFGIGLDCGDVNGDGYADILAMSASPTIAFLFYGGAELDSVLDWSYQAQSPVYLTALCIIVPNINGDQYSDIILEPSNIPDSYVFLGSENISSAPDQIINPSVGVFINIGDLDNDSYSDILGRNEIGSLIRPLYGSSSGLISGTIINTQYEPEATGKCGDINTDVFDDISYYTYYPNYFGQFFIYADTTMNALVPVPQPSFPAFALYQNYPNPFNLATEIPFELKSKQRIELNVYNILGKKVAELSHSEYEAGIHTVKWNAENIPSGLYFIQLKCGKQKEIKKLLLLR